MKVTPDLAEDAKLALLRSQVLSLQRDMALRDQRIAELESIALEDDLTGLLNRRGLHRHIDLAIGFVSRYEFPAALLYVDLDSFKAINDHYGHAAGDAVLVEVSLRMRSILRKSDGIGRIGGDEFVVIVWKNDAEAARVTAAKLARAIEDDPISTDAGLITLSASIGVTEVEATDTIDAVLTRADRDMFRQKRDRKRPREIVDRDLGA